MSIFTDIFAAQGETPDLTWCRPSPADVTAAIMMTGLLSDPDARWIPLAVSCEAADA